MVTYTMFGLGINWYFEDQNDCVHDTSIAVQHIDPFSVGKHGDVFMWAELRWRQNNPSGRFTNAS